MAGSLSHEAGGLVTFVNFSGACLSIHSLINELRDYMIYNLSKRLGFQNTFPLR